MTEKNSSENKRVSKANSSLIKILSWLIVGLCVVFLVIGLNIPKNVYMPILVIVLVSTISLFNLDRDDLGNVDKINLYIAAAIDIIALVMYFLKSMGKI